MLVIRILLPVSRGLASRSSGISFPANQSINCAGVMQSVIYSHFTDNERVVILINGGEKLSNKLIGVISTMV